MNNFLHFHHLGMAVKDFTKPLNFLKALGYTEEKRVIDEIYQNIEALMCINNNGMPNIELLKPINEKSPINNILKMQDSMIYHICYSTINLKQALHGINIMGGGVH